MRRSLLAAPMITLLLLLTACGGGDEAKFEALRETVQQSEISLTAEVTVLGSDSAETYTYDYTEFADGCEMILTAPELLAGVKGHITAGETALEYDGVILPAPLGENRRAPMTAVRQIMDAIRSGHLDLLWQEDDLLVCQLIPADEQAVRLYLDADGTPVAAELIYEDAAALRCQLSQWNVKRGTDDEPNDSNLG